MHRISNDGLRLAHIPAAAASMSELDAFAHTFAGYEACGAFERCAEIANAEDHSSLDKLRTCLFFEASRWHHVGEDLDAEDEAYWRLIVAKIRRIVEQRES